MEIDWVNKFISAWPAPRKSRGRAQDRRRLGPRDGNRLGEVHRGHQRNFGNKRAIASDLPEMNGVPRRPYSP